jgi:hypothetical protein
MVDEPNGAGDGYSPPGSSPSDRKPGQSGGGPDEHRVRTRAHQIWIEEGKPDGRDKEHWLRAHWEIEREGGQK